MRMKTKSTISVTIDTDLLYHLRNSDAKISTLINELLNSYFNAANTNKNIQLSEIEAELNLMQETLNNAARKKTELLELKAAALKELEAQDKEAAQNASNTASILKQLRDGGAF